MIGIRSAPSFDDRRRDDISRLLDPSYNTSYYRSTHRQNTYAAYVDAQGDMHDPDYRQFPLINKNHRYHSPGATRSHWELVDEDSALNTDDDDDFPEDFVGFSGFSQRNSFSSGSARYSPTKTRHQPQYHSTHYSSTRRSNSPTAGIYTSSGAILSQGGISPISTFTSSSSSSSSVLSRAQTPIDSDDSPKEKSRCRLTALKKKRRRSSEVTTEKEHEEERAQLARRNSLDFDDTLEQRRNRFVEDVEEEEEQEDDDEDLNEKQPKKEHGDWVPSCTESLRRQWHALSMRLRFGMFRAERRIKKRVQSLI